MAANAAIPLALRHALGSTDPFALGDALPAWANQATQHLNQHFRQLIRAPQDGKPSAAEDSRRIAWSLTIHGQTEHVDVLHPRFSDGLPRVLDAVRAFIRVDVVGLAVGQDQQQPAFGELTAERSRRVADRGSDSCVAVRLQCSDPQPPRSPARSVKRFIGIIDTCSALSPANAKIAYRSPNAAERFAHHEQRIFFDVHDPLVP